MASCPRQLSVDAGEVVLGVAGGAAQDGAEGADGGECLTGVLASSTSSLWYDTTLPPSVQLADLSGGMVCAGRVRARS